jgi:hypothetical protein
MTLPTPRAPTPGNGDHSAVTTSPPSMSSSRAERTSRRQARGARSWTMRWGFGTLTRRPPAGPTPGAYRAVARSGAGQLDRVEAHIAKRSASTAGSGRTTQPRRAARSVRAGDGTAPARTRPESDATGSAQAPPNIGSGGGTPCASRAGCGKGALQTRCCSVWRCWIGCPRWRRTSAHLPRPGSHVPSPPAAGVVTRR